jgi:hypothetical protein
MDLKFYKEVLFGGMTGNAFKLGTVLTGGWFWVRVSGCAVLYRGESLSTIDFDNILAVGDSEAGQIRAPGWLEHRAGGSYLYAVRRANGCGMVEYGLRGVAAIVFDNEGLLCRPGPNGIFGLTVRQAGSQKAELGWYYCPLGQGAEPASFAIYNNGVRIGTAEFKGRGFYSFIIAGLNDEKNCFAVKAEGKSGVQDWLARSLRFEISGASPGKARIVIAEAL